MRRRMRRLIATLPALLLVLLAVAPAADAFRLGGVLGVVKGNPANRLTSPVDPPAYDRATTCKTTPRPGTARLVRWLDANAAGSSWGTYRCERWGKGSASLHAEGRALDWHLDADVPADRAAGKRLIRLLLAPDLQGEPQALARRMGISEIIWDCSYWAAGMDEFQRYSPCFGRDGTRKKRVDRTTAHIDHIHVGLTKAGAMGRTSFWTTR